MQAGYTRLNAALSFVFLLLIVFGYAVQIANHGALVLEDDAYYYTVIAHNLATTGMSTFDGQTLTNGYHPLWLLVVTGLAKTVGTSPLILASLEALLATVGIFCLLTVLRSGSVVLAAAFVAIAAILATPVVGHGMEISLLIATLGLFALAVVRYVETGRGSFWLAATAALVIGSRIDAAVFVLPTLIFAAGSLRRAIPPLAVLALGGAVYAAVNLYLFGMPMPVSGAIKSLGGLQVNHVLIDTTLLAFSDGVTASSFAVFLRFIEGKMLVIFVLALLTLPFARRRSPAGALLGGFVVGFLFYAAKLTLGSSWTIWIWYGFPVFIGIHALFVFLDDRNAGLVQAQSRSATFIAWVASLVFVAAAGTWVAKLNGLGQPPVTTFEAINRKAAVDLAPVLAGARVAMGDRAGSFADAYNGPVTQIEGLVNDREFYETLKARGDLKALLCRRGVGYLLAYMPDLGAYETVDIPAIRPALSQFKSPSVTVAKADEVGRVADLTLFGPHNNGDGDHYLYAWRLSSSCPSGNG
jgi:hypothetical protein